MLSRQEITIFGRMPVAPSNKAFFVQPPLCALMIFAVIAFGTTVVSAQETPKPPLQTQPSPSPAAQPPPDQAPTSAPVPPKPVALYNLLQKKSIVFPDIAYSTERLAAGQKLRLSVDNSVSVDAGVWAALGSGGAGG